MPAIRFRKAMSNKKKRETNKRKNDQKNDAFKSTKNHKIQNSVSIKKKKKNQIKKKKNKNSLREEKKKKKKNPRLCQASVRDRTSSRFSCPHRLPPFLFGKGF